MCVCVGGGVTILSNFSTKILFFISDDFPNNLVYFCRIFLIESNFPLILLDTSSLLDFNEDASRESVAAATAATGITITASSKSFSKV